MSPLTESRTGDDLDSVMFRLAQMWRTVGYGSVNDEPVKQPTDSERQILTDLLTRALAAIKEG